MNYAWRWRERGLTLENVRKIARIVRKLRKSG
jgi:hypothetical protein